MVVQGIARMEAGAVSRGYELVAAVLGANATACLVPASIGAE